ncbi:5' nucleotidase, NT5C type [Aureivirga sp. CE67]|uniref:5' nucleotidase, NT5C type n=1 Tax=Aureivirga sp. CE67 TaxID=1788983 RepID=UPI0018CBCFDA|nr:hypothetical protein [Aureivirga sp. CE67]
MKKVVYIDMDGVLVDFEYGYNEVKKKYPEVQYPQNNLGFWESLPPIEGAIDAFKTLKNDNRFEVYILTSPSVTNPHCYSEKRIWVENHLGFHSVHNLIISPHKGLLKGNYLIDNEVSGKGQDHFEGELILFGSEKFNDWDKVLNYFEKI